MRIQNLPESWDPARGTNIRWKARIPGLAHSSPIVWEDRIFLTTAVSSRADASFKRGLYGEGTASDDLSAQQWKLICLDGKTGKIVWERIAYEGAPKEKRHIKSTYANATPATDGEVVVALFGSQGLYAYDLNGKLLWKRDLGRMDVGAYDAPDYEWGTASSPILYRDRVIIQCDQQKGSFLEALDRKSGQTVWRTERDEVPSWGTPTVYPGKNRAELITNGSNFVRGYDPATGKELWRLGGSSKITAPTPVFAADMIVVASGRRPEAPIFAIRAGAAGDITGHKSVAWQKEQRGPYMPTPLIYRGYLYILGNAGIFDCYDFKTGREIYRQRLAHQGSGFSASPVASDGKIYLSSEDGDIFIVKAGPRFELLRKIECGCFRRVAPGADGACPLGDRVRSIGRLASFNQRLTPRSGLGDNRRSSMPFHYKATTKNKVAILIGAAMLLTVPSFAQYGGPPPSYPPQELERLVSRIALYPDPLLAQILAGATYSDQIPDAARWADQHHYVTGDALARAISDDRLPWDPSVQALLPFPTVLDMMRADMNWTGQLGNAFLAQPQEVMDAVQRMRQRARDFGYLRSGGQVVVSGPGPYIEILPVNPAFVCVPYYDPLIVFARPRPGFVVAGGINFGFGVAIGAAFRPWGWGANRFVWSSHTVIVNNRGWDRRWVNRTTYVHPYTVPRYQAPRREERHEVRERPAEVRDRERPGRYREEERRR